MGSLLEGKGRSIITNNQESVGSIKLRIFDGRNFVYWKIKTTIYLQSLGMDVWEIVEAGYTFPTVIPTDTEGKSNMKPIPKLSIPYLEVCHNQSLSKSCSSSQPKKYGTKSF